MLLSPEEGKLKISCNILCHGNNFSKERENRKLPFPDCLWHSGHRSTEAGNYLRDRRFLMTHSELSTSVVILDLYFKPHVPAFDKQKSKGAVLVGYTFT